MANAATFNPLAAVGLPPSGQLLAGAMLTVGKSERLRLRQLRIRADPRLLLSVREPAHENDRRADGGNAVRMVMSLDL